MTRDTCGSYARIVHYQLLAVPSSQLPLFPITCYVVPTNRNLQCIKSKWPCFRCCIVTCSTNTRIETPNPKFETCVCSFRDTLTLAKLGTTWFTLSWDEYGDWKPSEARKRIEKQARQLGVVRIKIWSQSLIKSSESNPHLPKFQEWEQRSPRET